MRPSDAEEADGLGLFSSLRRLHDFLGGDVETLLSLSQGHITSLLISKSIPLTLLRLGIAIFT
jgi:hypothetical protein